MSLTISVSDIINQSTSVVLGKHESWERVELSAVADVLNGFAFDSANFNRNQGMPLIRIRDIASSSTETRYDGPYDEAYLIKLDDLLVGMDGDFNCAQWKGSIGLLNQRVCKVEAHQEFFDRELLSYVLPGYLKAINDFTSSMTVKHLSSKSVEEIPLPLPPRPEQARIVAAIEQQFTRLDSAVASLKSAQAKTKQYRASLLKSAVEGELTKEWRAAHSASETGEQLLERILTERRARWEEEQLAKMSEKGKLLIDEMWKEAYKEPPGPDVANLPGLPEGWCWAILEQCSRRITDGTHQPPRFVGSGIPFIFVKHIVKGKISFEDTRYISEATYQELNSRCPVELGDILYSAVGSYGVAVPVLTSRSFSFQRHIAHIKPSLLLNMNYLVVFLNSSVGLDQAHRVARGVAQKTVTLTDLAHFVLPLPPLAEQAQIVAEVEARLSEMAKTEETIGHSLRRAEQERQSILREAFAGRLVPQDPADEPASKLLERIREEREKRKKREETEQKRRKGERKMAVARKNRTYKTGGERMYHTLREAGAALKPEELFRQAGFKADEQPESVETFETELTPLEDAGAIVEEKPDDRTVVLRAVELSEEQLEKLFGTAEEASETDQPEEQPGQASLWDL